MSTRMQFGLREIITGITLFSLYLALWVAPEDIQGFLASLLYVGFITMAVTAILYGRGPVRAFWIGWLIPSGLLWLEGGHRFALFEGSGEMPLILIAASAISGGIGWATAWWLLSEPKPV